MARADVEDGLHGGQRLVARPRPRERHHELRLGQRGVVADDGLDGQLRRHLHPRDDVEVGRVLLGREEEPDAGPHAVGVQRLELVRGRDDDAKVLARAADAPEEVLVLLLRHVDGVPVGRDQLYRLQRVEHQPVQSVEAADAGAQRGSDRANAGTCAGSYGC